MIIILACTRINRSLGGWREDDWGGRQSRGTLAHPRTAPLPTPRVQPGQDEGVQRYVVAEEVPQGTLLSTVEVRTRVWITHVHMFLAVATRYHVKLDRCTTLLIMHPSLPMFSTASDAS